RRVDIVVRIELDHIVVNLLRLGDERRVVLRGAGAGREQKAQTEGELPFDVLHVSSMSGTATGPVEYSNAGARRGSASSNCCDLISELVTSNLCHHPFYPCPEKQKY